MRSVLDNPLADRRLDAGLISALAGVTRCGDLGPRDVVELEVLDDLATTSRDDLLLPDGVGWKLGQALGHALEQRVRLWLCEVLTEAVPVISRVLGDGIVHVVSLPEDAPSDGPIGTPATVVVAVSPLALVQALADGGEDAHRYLRTVLAGLDTLRCPRTAVDALDLCGVEMVRRSRVLRFFLNPVAMAYVVVFVYSSLRALPVAFVPGFYGHVWVLWAIDIVTAVPYTWGLVEMVAGRRIRHRVFGLMVTLVSFMAPYVYFWTKGKDYPRMVVFFVTAMIAGSIAVEVIRWARDRVIARGLAGHGTLRRKR